MSRRTSLLALTVLVVLLVCPAFGLDPLALLGGASWCQGVVVLAVVGFVAGRILDRSLSRRYPNGRRHR